MIVWRYTYSVKDNKLIVEEGVLQGGTFNSPTSDKWWNNVPYRRILIKKKYPSTFVPQTITYNASYPEGTVRCNALWLGKRDDERAMKAFTDHFNEKIKELDMKKDILVKRIEHIWEGVEFRDEDSRSSK